jgi:hypothetical protein
MKKILYKLPINQFFIGLFLQAQNAGDLDASFGTDGKVKINIRTGELAAKDIKTQSDGLAGL